MATTSAYTSYDTHKFVPGYVFGAELGGLMQAQRAHWALQISALYAQKGFQLQEIYQPAGRPTGTSYQIKETYRLNYLTLPVNVVYTQHATGQGFQVFAGGYMCLLLNGKWEYDDRLLEPQPNGDVYGAVSLSHEKEVRPSQKQPPVVATGLDNYIYSRRVDAGVQAGLGYCYSHILLQGTYSLGFVNLAPTSFTGTLVYGPSSPKSYANRGMQLSVSYLLGKNE
ncbi:Outer membrane protein beta-barrel domain-containing protein [Hymenobacter gelipurpurascens]|uniref:Outer membrane protein beta-barrel domain-containing protein n=2 Tax=Hymenobacter gelipurpurascens TaxID=89968 RepID=A0A212TA28_9BACT|nr:Outer membrane protein beta-barrel domain-containing protein [Hymenobacter gelipurpurascens]